MRAIHVSTDGQAPTLGELPEPEVVAGTVLIRVMAAGLNPIDAIIARGLLTNMLPHEYPLVLGRDASGIVEAVGHDVSGIHVGDHVFGHVPLTAPIRLGTLADFAVLPADTVAKKPVLLDHLVAAALPLSGAAAVSVVEAVGPVAGQTILVNGASGGVGSFVVQMLVARGGEVIGTGSASDVERLLRLGVANVVDFTLGPIAEQVRDVQPTGVDSLVNLFGMSVDQVPLSAVRQGGIVVTTTSAPKADSIEASGLRVEFIHARPQTDVLDSLARGASDGTLSVEVEATVPLTEAIEWLSTIAAGGAHGKIVVDLST
jgi:NADPH:quinone reductase-like Zn-dependent oxidoreductase